MQLYSYENVFLLKFYKSMFALRNKLLYITHFIE